MCRYCRSGTLLRRRKFSWRRATPLVSREGLRPSQMTTRTAIKHYLLKRAVIRGGVVSFDNSLKLRNQKRADRLFRMQHSLVLMNYLDQTELFRLR
ncbi:hypothetical protein EVAR_26544_1 [Eumeta japonica]|uniref:Uncharacterized protein n=1 Tax=Eumeta variegata TaxID=151549 RepID=A0A4C1YSW0_EUMVA|nr:hypothetical protein EVAR_26544_1 [Eumeta japonica]